MQQGSPMPKVLTNKVIKHQSSRTFMCNLAEDTKQFKKKMKIAQKLGA